ncbi:MAG: DUF3575 domain-containing protein [Bacteroidota bacterium]
MKNERKLHLGNWKTLLTMMVMNVLLAGGVLAQDENDGSGVMANEPVSGVHHSFSMCPGGLALGILSVNYEYLFQENHGIVARFDYESIPSTYSDAKLESSGLAFILNYRYHIAGGMEAVYVGAFTRLRNYSGTGTLESTSFDFSIPEVTFGLNIGKKWVWSSGITLNFALGYGVAKQWREADPRNAAIDASLDVFEDEYDFISPLLGELSIGYAF